MRLILATLLLIVTTSGSPTHGNLEDMQHVILQAMEQTPKAERFLEERAKRAPTTGHIPVNPRGDNINDINEGSDVIGQYFQGDIALSLEQKRDIVADLLRDNGSSKRTKRQAFSPKLHKKLWKDGIVYYSFNKNISKELRNIFKKAAESWTKDSCVQIIKNPDAEDRISVQSLKGCSSELGRKGGVQGLSLGPGCESVGIAAHELGHALGFYHTQSRYDRDQFIAVDKDNIKKCMADEFIKQTPDTNDNYNLTYDYGSIMQYPGIKSVAPHKFRIYKSWNAWSNQCFNATMIPYDISYQATLGSPFVSFIDVLMLNKLYGCTKSCDPPTESVKCENGGYPHPQNCQKCVCPRGYSGVRCTERPDNGCGQTFTASSEWATFKDSIGDKDSFSTRDDFTECNYWIESPEGTEIEVEILKVYNQYDSDGCPYAGVEIKTNKDQQLTGYRFCSPFAKGLTLRSYTNRVPIITYNRAHQTTVTVAYRSVDPSAPRPTYQTVRPFSTTAATTTTISPTTTTLYIAPKRKCEDHPKCPIYELNGICTRDYFTVEFRKQMCPKMCNLCD